MCMECGGLILKAPCRWPSLDSTSARTTRTRFRTPPKLYASTKNSSWKRYQPRSSILCPDPSCKSLTSPLSISAVPWRPPAVHWAAGSDPGRAPGFSKGSGQVQKEILWAGADGPGCAGKGRHWVQVSASGIAGANGLRGARIRNTHFTSACPINWVPLINE